MMGSVQKPNLQKVVIKTSQQKILNYLNLFKCFQIIENPTNPKLSSFNHFKTSRIIKEKNLKIINAMI